MASSDETAFLQERLTATETLIVATETAITALTNGAQSYELNTGQTVQRVTKASYAQLVKGLKDLYERRTMLRNQLGLANSVGSVVVVRPAY